MPIVRCISGITPARVNDIIAPKAMPIEPEATYVFDLGCYDYGWWAEHPLGGNDRPRRRLLAVLASQGYAPNQKLVLMSDGGESERRLVSQIGPEAEHVLDRFHVTMRLTVLVQMTKGACPDPGWTERRLADLERLKWLLWHGHVRHAVEAAEGFAEDAWCMRPGRSPCGSAPRPKNRDISPAQCRPDHPGEC
jgi:hypothetical protein